MGAGPIRPGQVCKAEGKCLNKLRLEAAEMLEKDATRACAAISRCESRWVAQAEAEEEGPSDGLHVALPHTPALAAWRAEFKHSK